MMDVEIIHCPAAAAVALEPIRSRFLWELSQPASAATLASRVGIPRQKINYHLHRLEKHKLIRVAEKRKWGGLTERLLQATASSYVVSPGAMGAVAPDPDAQSRSPVRQLHRCVGSAMIREIGTFLRRSASPTSGCRRFRSTRRFASARLRTARRLVTS